MKQGTSSLLINEGALQVLPSLACAVGLNEAIMLQQLHYWLLASENFLYEKRWVYNDYEEWHKIFPFWSERTIQRTFLALEKAGLIESCQPGGQDRSKWYTINYDLLNSLEIKPKKRKSDSANLARSRCQIGTLNMPERHDDIKDTEITQRTPTNVGAAKPRTAIKVCREVTGRPPNQKQRELINSQVTDLDHWETVLTTYMSEGQPPHRVDWMLERYGKSPPRAPTETKEQRQIRQREIAERMGYGSQTRPDARETVTEQP